MPTSQRSDFSVLFRGDAIDLERIHGIPHATKLPPQDSLSGLPAMRQSQKLVQAIDPAIMFTSEFDASAARPHGS